MYDLISGVFGSAFGGAFGLSPADIGAAAQQANEEAFRRIQDSWIPAPPFTPEQEAEYMRLTMNAWPMPIGKEATTPAVTWFDRESARRYAEERIRGIDWLYWGLLAWMALALIVRWWVSR